MQLFCKRKREKKKKHEAEIECGKKGTTYTLCMHFKFMNDFKFENEDVFMFYL